MTAKELRQAITFAGRLTRQVGTVLRSGLSKHKKVRFKSSTDPVTEYDLKAERLILSQLTKFYPNHAILSEEGSGVGAVSDFRWVIDPLDGTVNYSHGYPVYGVSIALQHRGESIVGAIYDPERDELFCAARGIGAYMNGRKINVSGETRLSRSLLSTGFAYEVRTARPNNLGLFARMVKTAQAVRRAGSAALDLSWLACGRQDGFWEYDLHPWDTAAAIVIVEEAGGKVSRFDGSKYSIFNRDIIASNGRIHAQLKKALRTTGKRRRKA